jgi:hypothetical protein
MPSIRRSPPDKVSARWVRRSQIRGNSSRLLAIARSAISPEAALDRAMSRFSRTVRLPNTYRSASRNAMPRPMFSEHDASLARLPSNERWPRQICWVPKIAESSVDLPAPLCPTMPTPSPASTWMEMSSMAVTLP